MYVNPSSSYMLVSAEDTKNSYQKYLVTSTMIHYI